jgi:integrase/recombinase XerD
LWLLLVAIFKAKTLRLLRINDLVLEVKMKQAKTLTQAELRKVLDFVARRRQASRNRAILMAGHLSGMRVGELAALRICDVIDHDGKVKSEIHLRAEQTKGNDGRTVMVSEKLHKEMTAYVKTLDLSDMNAAFFWTQKRSAGFSANTLAQHLMYIYRRAGIEGASSHSARRTFITNLAAQGVSVRVLMSLAGHKNISTTQAYIDVNDDMKRKAVELAY